MAETTEPPSDAGTSQADAMALAAEAEAAEAEALAAAARARARAARLKREALAMAPDNHGPTSNRSRPLSNRPGYLRLVATVFT